ncbi:Endonuclease IV [Jatrophihabitans endophyticus]|uniref:Probable endonuclease 4 n=1 Tax=Jatrophihabitans endophyticus TaxID=1206085 RepID=A0A1M5L7B4_9ACTN|nr:deoxyribonuclease IV [Jatrophihabitans endophyticus]SHG60303.1 Endonuclease IV [Jatrophihabitans endophyticus]
MPARPLAPVGAHVSVAGGLSRALPRADTVGAEVLQVFVANPRGWAPPAPDPAGDDAFRVACTRPVFVHAPYLINFGSPSVDTLARSSGALRFSLERGRAIGARGVVVHAGSAVLGNRWDDAMAQVREHVLPVLDDVAGGPRLLIEPTAGGGGALASDADSLGAYLDVLGRDERVGVCLDTCHVHAAGHDLATAASFATALRAYGRAAGRGRIGLVHVNDSRDAAGSRRDRHAALGRGTIGAADGGAAFAALFTSPVTRRVPMVVETADTDHAADIALLQRLRAAT